jgi:sec-independent protein translocase protein TatA
MGELLIILVIVMLIFGAGKLPAIGDAIGRSIKNFKRAANGNDEIEVSKQGELSGGKSSGSLRAGDDYADVVGKRSRRDADDPVER